MLDCEQTPGVGKEPVNGDGRGFRYLNFTPNQRFIRHKKQTQLLDYGKQINGARNLVEKGFRGAG